MRRFAPLLIAAALALAPAASRADDAHAEVRLPDTNFSFEGIFGTFDRAAAQRGFQVYKEVCSACHSMRQLSYRHLRAIGFSEAQVTALASQQQVQDGPNDNGEMFERPARPSDRFRNPFPNDAAARAANNSALPPDLSVITKARAGGADYIHALLTGYAEPPEGVTIASGMHYNKFFPGHQIAMAAPLNTDGQLTFADGTQASVDQMATDVSTFLAWASEPELEQRRAMGVRMLIFLGILACLAYGVKRKIWAGLH